MVKTAAAFLLQSISVICCGQSYTTEQVEIISSTRKAKVSTTPGHKIYFRPSRTARLEISNNYQTLASFNLKDTGLLLVRAIEVRPVFWYKSEPKPSHLVYALFHIPDSLNAIDTSFIVWEDSLAIPSKLPKKLVIKPEAVIERKPGHQLWLSLRLNTGGNALYMVDRYLEGNFVVYPRFTQFVRSFDPDFLYRRPFPYAKIRYVPLGSVR